MESTPTWFSTGVSCIKRGGCVAEPSCCSDHQPGSESSDEPDQSSVSRLEHPLCRYPGVCSALSGRVATEDRACGGTPASRAALSAVGWIADVTTNPASRVIGGEPET